MTDWGALGRDVDVREAQAWSGSSTGLAAFPLDPKAYGDIGKSAIVQDRQRIWQKGGQSFVPHPESFLDWGGVGRSLPFIREFSNVVAETSDRLATTSPLKLRVPERFVEVPKSFGDR